MQIEKETKQKILEAYGKLPLAFVPNAGQMQDQSQFYAQGRDFRFAFGPENVWMTFFKNDPKPSIRKARFDPLFSQKEEQGQERGIRGINLAWRFLNARSGVTLEGSSPEKGTINYFHGSDPKWHYTNLPVYREVVYRQLWPGIDVVFQGHEGTLKYDVILQPGARVEDFRLICEGADEIRLDDTGNLLFDTPFGTFMDIKPMAYQEVEHTKKPVGCCFVIRSEADGNQSVGFEITEEYNPSYPLVIDPILVYSTYLGGSGNDEGLGIAVDSSGNAYVTGSTNSTNFPTTPGAFQTTSGGSSDAFITKLNPTGTALVYSTYLGGSGFDLGNGIAVDSSGNAYVTGETNSTNFPTTPGAFQTTSGGSSDAFITKLNPTGTALVYSTYLGGSGFDEGNGIAVDVSGNAYVTGETNSTNFPTTLGAFQTTFGGGPFDAFVTKLNPTGTALVYSTYLGGSGRDVGFGIAVDAFGNTYLTGQTNSTNFPTTPGAIQTTFGGGPFDAFVTKLNPTGTALVYSTYLGGSGRDDGFGIAVDASGNAYITGQTNSINFPTTPGAFQTTFGGSPFDAFVTKLNPTGTALVYSTYLGGSDEDEGFGIAVDAFGNAYITGKTDSTNFPTTPDAFQTTFGGGPFDAFVTKLNQIGTALVYSTYLGGSQRDDGLGIAVDASGNAYVTGRTNSTDFPTTPGAFQTTIGGVPFDAFVANFFLQMALSFSTGVIPNQTVAGPIASTIQVLISNDNSSNVSTIEIEAFYLSGASRVPYVHELFSVAPGTVISRSYFAASFTAYEIQYFISGTTATDVLVSVFPIDNQGNAVAAARVIQTEATPIESITPVP